MSFSCPTCGESRYYNGATGECYPCSRKRTEGEQRPESWGGAYVELRQKEREEFLRKTLKELRDKGYTLEQVVAAFQVPPEFICKTCGLTFSGSHSCLGLQGKAFAQVTEDPK